MLPIVEAAQGNYGNPRLGSDPISPNGCGKLTQDLGVLSFDEEDAPRS
jgi:hypothetical protein